MKTRYLVTMIAALSVSATAFAAGDGEALFNKSKCNTCHKLDAKSYRPVTEGHVREVCGGQGCSGQNGSEGARRYNSCKRIPKKPLRFSWIGRVHRKRTRSARSISPNPASAKSVFTDDDLSIEWGFIQQQTKKTNVPVSIAHDMTLLREVQRELGMP